MKGALPPIRSFNEEKMQAIVVEKSAGVGPINDPITLKSKKPKMKKSRPIRSCTFVLAQYFGCMAITSLLHV